jgi:hypothetical protein
MTQKLTTALLVLLAAAVSTVGCDLVGTPEGPSQVLSGTVNAGFELRGSVYASTDRGEPMLEGVNLTLFNGVVQVATVTDKDGHYVAAGLTAGTWTLTLSKAGYLDHTVEVDIRADTTLNCSLRPE